MSMLQNLPTDSYPGRDTDFFVVVDGRPKGPFKGLRQVFELNITPDTPIWYQGLEYWTPAAIDEVTRQLFDPGSAFYAANPDALDVMKARTRGLTTPNRPDPSRLPDPPAPAKAPEGAAPSVVATAAPVGAIALTAVPKSYIVGSLLILFLMSLPAGVIALIYSFKTRRKIREADIAAAARASEISQLWIAIGIVLGLIWMVAWPLISAGF